jgi:hypothetical protein
VAVQHPLERSAQRSEARIPDGALTEGRRVARADEQGIAFPQRHVERVGEPEDDPRPGTERPLSMKLEAHRLADLLCFDWQMVPRETGDVAATGTEILLLTADGQIRVDYQLNVR